MNPKKANVIWITGASSGIGAELARLYAQKGWQVALSARSKDKMEELAKQLDGYHGQGHVFPCDVTDALAVADTVAQIEKDIGPINLAVLNAGTYVPDTARSFTVDNFQLHTRVNMEGTANCVAPLLKVMKERKSGHIAIVASVAGYRGLPRSLSYGPSKAGLINFAEALAIEGQSFNIKVQVINPGFVETPLTAQNDFDMPFIISAEKAARHIEQGLESAKFAIEFPWQMVLMLKTLGLFPARLYFKLVSKATSSHMTKKDREKS